MSFSLSLHFFLGVESGDQCLHNSKVLSCFPGVIMSIRSFFYSLSDENFSCQLLIYSFLSVHFNIKLDLSYGRISQPTYFCPLQQTPRDLKIRWGNNFLWWGLKIFVGCGKFSWGIEIVPKVRFAMSVGHCPYHLGVWERCESPSGSKG